MSASTQLHAVNISTTNSGENLKGELQQEALARGISLRTMTALIYAYAVRHKADFRGKLESPRRKGGEYIGADVVPEVFEQLNDWARSRATSRGVLCKYILETALEKELLERILNDLDEPR